MELHMNEVDAPVVIDDLANATFKVNRQAFTDPAIWELERQRVFDQCWLYVGHESELTEAGSFLTRKVGGRPVIFVRDGEGEVRVFFDSCPHRGNSVCRGSRGQADRFTCFYHGWAFNTKGELAVVPDPVGYGPGLDRSKLGLGRPPRLEHYRGLYFLSMKPDIVDLRTYLGGAIPYIDSMLDIAVADPVIAAGEQAYNIKANWKLLLENSADIYHGHFTHMRFFTEFLTDVGADLDAWRKIARGDDQNRVETFDYGHAVIDTPIGPLPLFSDKPEVFAKLNKALVEKFGADRAAQLLGRSQNLLIFPNTVMISSWRTIRTFYPVAPDDLECRAWAIVGAEDSPELREARFGNFISFLGPAGFGTPDDVEALENCQRGFAAAGVPYNDLSKGMGRPGGAVANDELQMRAVWRRWAELMDPDFEPGIEKSAAMLAAAE
ncbi:aromatic ring-hydroxylating oxygenase subunit alpha [Actibacterium sp. D379-3]